MTSKAVHLVRHLAHATRAQSAHTQNKEELIGQVQKVKFLVKEPRVRKDVLYDELARLETQVGLVLNLEKHLIRKETGDINDLKNQLRDMRLRQSLTESGELPKRLDRILFLISELAARVDSYASVKENREKRMEELEGKIKESVERNFKELITLEKSITALERRYEELKQNRDVDQKHLRHIERRLKELRQKLLEKKGEIAEKRKEEFEKKLWGMPLKPEEELPAPKPVSALSFTPKPIPPPVVVESEVPEEQETPLTPEKPEPRHKMLFPEFAPSMGEEKKPSFPLFKEEKPVGERFAGLKIPPPPRPERGFTPAFEEELPPVPPLPREEKKGIRAFFQRLFRK